MRISIIGTGSVGSALTRRLTAAGHQVTIANSRGPHTLSALASGTGAQARKVGEAVADADVVILAVPFGAVPDLAGALADLSEEAVLADAGNYVPVLRDALIGELDDGGTESTWIAGQLGRPVVKAFNTITAAHLAALARPAGAPDRIALPVAGDAPEATARVRAVVDSAGFDPVDAGPLANSWRQQPGTPVYTADLNAADVRAALARAVPQDTRTWRRKIARVASGRTP
ncbi:NADPH-dependent F420 reductase [Streptomyces sp. NPDC026672]|uniref:NADPH-dependent F420 reductase n=1 Tax=unclassified Streptomyces TaxID=2593676 RepID=UPI0033FD02A4